MRRLPVLGLRGRIVAALILISAVVLGVAAVTLLPPLENDLRREEVSSLRATAIASRPSFEDLEHGQVNVRSQRLGRLAEALERRTGARVLLFDAAGTRLLDTQPRHPGSFGDVQRAFSTRKPVEGVSLNGPQADVARLALPLTIDHRPYVLVLRKPLDDAQVGSRVVKHAFTTATLVGLGVALVLGAGLAATLVRRLRRLRDATLMLAEHGLDAELASDSAGDEVGDLARAFTTMQARLREQEQARRAFVATASHELRTPLASLNAMLELLAEDIAASPPDLADARNQVSRAREQSTRLAGLASDLLDLSRLDSRAPLRREPVELGELCRAVAAEFEVEAGEHRPRLAYEEPSRACWATADPGAVARILRIVVDNALRFSPPSEPVTVRVGAGGGSSWLAVTDRGPGIPEPERSIIFERFQRGTSTGGEAGFGLGLAIGRELAERMGGTLTLEPAKAGARFLLRLPAAAPLHDLMQPKHEEARS
jgi:signal transduction histidine kinase